jgi:hypothetical protein
MTDPRPRSTSAQLKGDINSGRTGDKVPAFDPAAAPLGTDEEAAGTPTPGWAIDAERRMHAERRVRLDLQHGTHAGNDASTRGRARWYWLAALAGVVLVIAGVALAT